MSYLVNKDKVFLSSNFTCLSTAALPIAIGILELPIASIVKHKYSSDGRRGLNIKLSGNAIVFK